MEIDKVNIQYWDKVAKEYSADLQDGKNDFTVIYQPAIHELLGNLFGKRILDAGCGDGYYSRKLASKQAVVTGIDGSKEFITIARSKSPEMKVDYRVMDLSQKLELFGRI